jgi:hypothetical protein
MVIGLLDEGVGGDSPGARCDAPGPGIVPMVGAAATA